MAKELLSIRKNVRKPHVRKVLKGTITSLSKDFDKRFDKYWDEKRVTAAHGKLDILDPIKMEQSKKHAYELQLWVREFLINYLRKNQIDIRY